MKRTATPGRPPTARTAGSSSASRRGTRSQPGPHPSVVRHRPSRTGGPRRTAPVRFPAQRPCGTKSQLGWHPSVRHQSSDTTTFLRAPRRAEPTARRTPTRPASRCSADDPPASPRASASFPAPAPDPRRSPTPPAPPPTTIPSPRSPATPHPPPACRPAYVLTNFVLSFGPIPRIVAIVPFPGRILKTKNIVTHSFTIKKLGDIEDRQTAHSQTTHLLTFRKVLLKPAH